MTALVPRALATALTVVCLTSAALAQKSVADDATTKLRVYFTNPRISADPNDCAAVFALPRSVPKTQAVATAALRQLFAGPTATEREAGYRSPFSDATAGLLRRVRIVQGTAYVDLHDPRERLAGATSSCGAAELHSQVEHTLRQFTTVKRALFAIEGDPRAFSVWMGEGCGTANDHCDARPFGKP